MGERNKVGGGGGAVEENDRSIALSMLPLTCDVPF